MTLEETIQAQTAEPLSRTSWNRRLLHIYSILMLLVMAAGHVEFSSLSVASIMWLSVPRPSKGISCLQNCLRKVSLLRVILFMIETSVIYPWINPNHISIQQFSSSIRSPMWMKLYYPPRLYWSIISGSPINISTTSMTILGRDFLRSRIWPDDRRP